MLRLVMWNWLAKNEGGSYNNTSTDVPRRIESTARDRNEIAGSNTFAEDLFLEHDDNDRGIRSTLSKYCWRTRYFLILFVFDIHRLSRFEFSNSVPRWDLILHFLSWCCPTSALSRLFNLVLYFENSLRIVAQSCTIVLFINTVHAGALKPRSSTRAQWPNFSVIFKNLIFSLTH